MFSMFSSLPDNEIQSFSLLPPDKQLDLLQKSRNDQTLLYALFSKINFTRQNSEKKTFIILAAENARAEKDWSLVKLIAEYVITKNTYEKSTLHSYDRGGFGIALLMAIEDSQREAVRLLIKTGAPKDCLKQEDPYKGQGGLHIAILKNDKKMRNLLAKYKTYRFLANEKKFTPAALALYQSYWSHLEFFLEKIHVFDNKESNRTAFFKAVVDKQYVIVTNLLQIAEDSQACIHNVIDNDGNTPLHYIVNVDDQKMLQVFLNNVTCDFSIKNKQGTTPTELAYTLNNKKMMNIIYQYEVEKMYEECLKNMRDEIETTPWKTRNFWGTTFVDGMPKHIENLSRHLNPDKNKNLAQIFYSIEKELGTLSPSDDVDITVTTFNVRYKACIQTIREKELDICRSYFAPRYHQPVLYAVPAQPTYVPLETNFYSYNPGLVTNSFYTAYSYDDNGRKHFSYNPVPVNTVPYYYNSQDIQTFSILETGYTNPLYLAPVPAAEIRPVYLPFNDTKRHSRIFTLPGISPAPSAPQQDEGSQFLLSQRF